MQQHGHIIEHDGVLGIVESVGSAVVAHPDRVTVDAASGEEVSREARPNLDVQEVHVVYEDGTTGTLTELADTWTVLGSVVVFPPVGDPARPAPGSLGELPEQRAEVEAAVSDVANYCAQVRAAAPLAAARAAVDRVVTVVDDGVLSRVDG